MVVGEPRYHKGVSGVAGVRHTAGQDRERKRMESKAYL